MSGHSKFANIKHKKEKNDAKKGKIFTVIGREIVMAVKAGGPDPANNSKLRDVIAKAKANNMPNDTIDRGIKKAAGADSADSYEKAVYEGYGPNGVAIIVETLTDNKNRTASNVKNAFTKGSGNVGTPGCVSFMFDKKGQIVIDKEEYEATKPPHRTSTPIRIPTGEPTLFPRRLLQLPRLHRIAASFPRSSTCAVACRCCRSSSSPQSQSSCCGTSAHGVPSRLPPISDSRARSPHCPIRRSGNGSSSHSSPTRSSSPSSA